MVRKNIVSKNIICYITMIRKNIVFIILLLYCLIGHSQQTLYMGVSGHNEVVSDNCVLYDDGGSNGNHSSRVNASYTIRATNPSHHFKVTIISKLDWYNNSSIDRVNLEVLKGDISSTDIIQQLWYRETYMCYVDTNVLSVKFSADDDDPQEGFEIYFEACNCIPPSDVQCQYIDSTTVQLSWQGEDNVPYTIEYVETSTTHYYYKTFADPSYQVHTVQSNTNSVTITNLTPNTGITYHVYGEDCNSVDRCGILGEFCASIEPENVTYTIGDDSIYFNWDDVEGVNWFFSTDPGLEDYGMVSSNHLVLPKICNQNTFVCIVGTLGDSPMNCWNNYSDNNLYTQDVYFGCPEVNNAWCKDILYNSITVWWDDIDTIDYYVVGYKETNSSDDVTYYDTIARGIQECTINNLKEATDYTFFVYTLCDECEISPGRSFQYKTPLNNCLDFTNFAGANTYLTWGTYEDPYYESPNNPYNSWGIISDRQVMNVDTNEYDAHTNYQLRIIPPGEKASVRLGNDNIGAQAESISYEYTVDSTEYDMIRLQYAVVLQDPGHELNQQPRFTLEILDENDQLIDSLCGFADFYASGDLGWNSVEVGGQTNLYKDWTTLGVDIAPYHEQTIKIRLTTYDCQEGGHFGYAYFTLDCAKKRIYLVNLCDAQDSIHLQAPLGFEYKWYKENDTTLLSTNYEIIVPIDSTNYSCLASFIGNPECNFTLSTTSINLMPHSEINYRIDACEGNVYFENLSYLDFDTTYSTFTEHIMDSSFWIFEDGTVSFDREVVRHYDTNGVYDIRLMSLLSNSQCADSAYAQITIDFVCADILAVDTVCQRDTIVLYAAQLAECNIEEPVYLWNTGETTDSIIFVADQTRDFSLSLRDGETCKGSAIKTIVVHPTLNDTIYASICEGEVYSDEYFEADSTGVYYHSSITDAGCTNWGVLHLTVNPVYDTLIFDTICMGSVYTQHGFNESESGLYTNILQNEFGCDSIIHLQLTVQPSFFLTLDENICEGEIYSEYGFSENSTGTYIQSYRNIYNCDSVITLNLTVNPNYEYTISAEICQGETYTENGFNENETGLYTRHLTSSTGCDSIVHLDLLVNPTYNDTIYSSLCGMPYEDDNFYQEESGIYTEYMQTEHGCDSLLTLNFTRFELFADTLDVEIFAGETYSEHGFSESESGEYNRVFTDENGCDSSYYLNLHIINLHFPNMVSANDDGINDTFEIIGLLGNTYFSYNQLAIYTRYGKRIYLKENISKKEDFWSPAATKSAAGTYFYRFKAKGKTKDFEFTGSVEVFR